MQETVWNIAITEDKKSINLTGVFSDKAINFTNEPSVWHSFVKSSFEDDDDIQLVTNRFDRNTDSTVSGGNFVYSFSFIKNWSIQSYSPTYVHASLTNIGTLSAPESSYL